MSAEETLPLSADLILIFVAAALICSGLILVLRPLLVRYALARPNGRSSHREPTPQGGGIAVIAATTLVLLGQALITPAAFPDSLKLAVIFACVIGLSIIGATDDIRPLDALPRLAFQALAVLIILAMLPSGFRILSFIPWWIERALLFVALLWFVNLVNFMDGLDWMTVAEVVPVSAALVLFGLMGALPREATFVALALYGATIGFAPFNRPVARLFLGDVGSLPIGLLLGWLLILLAGKSIVAALLLPLYYLADATITLIRRFLRGEKVTQAHRTHFYQRATDGGLTVLGVVSRVFIVNCALALLAAIALVRASSLVSIAALAAGCILVALLLARFAWGKR